jgi:hypothetical protein
MSYLALSRIYNDGVLQQRVLACARQEGVSDPVRWVSVVYPSLVGSDWVAAWVSATVAGEKDIGANEAVVTDQMILSAVQRMMQETS